jgi:Spy/CpxP family protein refolding chaperone
MEDSMTKRSTALALAFALLIALTGLRVAAQTDASSVDPETKAKVQEKLQQISSELNLTDAQKAQLKPILQSEVQQFQAVKNDTSLSPDQKQAKVKEIQQTYRSQMSSVLTPEQQKKWATMKEEATQPK